MVSVLLISVVMSVAAPAEVPAAADPFRDALVESIHHFAAEGKLAHLQAILDKFPKLLDAKRDQQLGKPSHGDGYTPLQTAARPSRGRRLLDEEGGGYQRCRRLRLHAVAFGR